jgi:hypothetical protein
LFPHFLCGFPHFSPHFHTYSTNILLVIREFCVFCQGSVSISHNSATQSSFLLVIVLVSGSLEPRFPHFVRNFHTFGWEMWKFRRFLKVWIPTLFSARAEIPHVWNTSGTFKIYLISTPEPHQCDGEQVRS